MKILFSSFFLLLILGFMNSNHDCREHQQMINHETKVKRTFSHLEKAHESNHVVLDVDAELKNFTKTADKEKVNSALDLLRDVLNSQEFRDRVINHQWNGKRQFANNDGMTNEEVLNVILEARETLLPNTPGIVNVTLALYTPKWWQVSQRNVVGYTNPDTLQINMNTKFFRNFNSWDVTGNIAHEWTHKLGFGHDFNRTAQRPYSVPYAVGDIAAELAQKHAQGMLLH